MSTEKLITALMSGFSDSLALPRLALAAMLVLLLLLYRDEKPFSARFFTGFITGHFLTALALRFGEFYPGFPVVRSFQLAAFFYTGIGLVLILAGGYFAVQWYRFYRPGGQGQGLFKTCSDRKARWFTGFVLWIGLCCGVCFSFFAFTWPVNVALMALSGDIYLPGLLWSAVWCLFIYELAIALALTIFFLLVRYCLDKQRRGFMVKHRSLMLSVMAGIFMSLGFGLAKIFIQEMF